MDQSRLASLTGGAAACLTRERGVSRILKAPYAEQYFPEGPSCEEGGLARAKLAAPYGFAMVTTTDKAGDLENKRIRIVFNF